jgi:hypothetical protein
MMNRVFRRSLIGIRQFSHHETPESRIHSLGLHLPAAGVPKGNYVNCVQVGKIIYCAGM